MRIFQKKESERKRKGQLDKQMQPLARCIQKTLVQPEGSSHSICRALSSELASDKLYEIQ